ncbi:MAG: hypothetical protein ACI89D_002211 [Bermanella sp.]|jgi:hypothetical protein
MNSEVESRLVGGVVVLVATILLLADSYGVLWLNTVSAVGYLLLGVCVLANGWERMIPVKYSPIFLDPAEASVQAAFARARSEILRFSDGVKYSQKEATARFCLPSADGHNEQVWAAVHKITGNSVLVSIPSELGKRPSLADPRSELSLDELEDGLLVDGYGNTEGGYTFVEMAKKYLRYKGYIPRGLRLQLLKFVDVDMSEFDLR